MVGSLRSSTIKEERKMGGKYKYICYCDLSPEGNKVDQEGWKKYFEKEDKLLKENEIKAVFRGVPFGVSESYVTVYESDKYIDDLISVLQEAGRGDYVQAARTITVTPFAW